jgi:ferredoxin
VIVGAAAGLAFIPVARASDDIDANYNPKLIRPPGSLSEREFLERCIKCGECMKVCPNNALHPAFMEGGIEGIWSPILIPRIGYCEFSCTLCGQACPTGAIRRITPDEKMGNREKKVIPLKIGTAFYDKGRCLPWSMNTPCIVCEEFCPTSPKAIWAQEVEIAMREPGTGHSSETKKQKLKQPVVQPDLCIGCGACEKVCPVQDSPAVYVTSIGETRSKTNVLLLENTKY